MAVASNSNRELQPAVTTLSTDGVPMVERAFWSNWRRLLPRPRPRRRTHSTCECWERGGDGCITYRYEQQQCARSTVLPGTMCSARCVDCCCAVFEREFACSLFTWCYLILSLPSSL
ncbi:predicted protein [Plenodomus lingam JN3]|uniref:Predicted protein n=1 Tax=Leptosphaeria maculans (strain JN3 / isolate v23.1.3 / race Av1-4-5-6-7-8) TaxID=985895 RepID=E4ZJC1_LEPMJ|nr:predicted protein [Plenodomus lingam JN3]CBX91552.1 predicted protein [Plenodomus lingam JN3]